MTEPSALTELYLTDGVRTMVLDPSTGWHRTSVDIGFPAVRAVSGARPDADGEDDTTAHHGAAAVTLAARLVDAAGRTHRQMIDELRAFCHPTARPWLVYTEAGEQRQVRLRADAQAAPLLTVTHRDVQVSWRAPDGVSESLAEEIGVAFAVPTDEGGFGFDLAFDLSFPASSAVGSTTVTNRGNTDVRPVLRLYGPATDPRVENQTTGERLLFTGLTIAAGDWLEIDCREATIRLNGLVEQSRYSRLDFAASQFLRLIPGPNTVRYYPVVFADGARIEVRYHSAWLGG